MLFAAHCIERVWHAVPLYSMTEFVANRLKGAKSRVRLASPPALRKAITTSSLAMPEFVEVVANFVGVWSWIILYLKETVRKDDGHSLLVRSSPFYRFTTISDQQLLCLWYLEWDRRVFICGQARRPQVPSALNAAWNFYFWSCILRSNF